MYELATRLKCKSLNFSLFNICLLDAELPEDDLQEIETCRSLDYFYVKVYFNTCAFVGVNY